MSYTYVSRGTRSLLGYGDLSRRCCAHVMNYKGETSVEVVEVFLDVGISVEGALYVIGLILVI